MTSKQQAKELPLEDLALLAGLQRGNDWLRAVLCTLARRGLGFRQRHPARAEQLLAILSRYPYFKAGQFLFDLMEWEDFMLDGEPPPLAPTTLDGPALKRMAGLLNAFRAHLDGGQPLVVPDVDTLLLVSEDEDLPALEPSLYLYHEVVLGILCSVRPLLQVQSPPDGDGPDAVSGGLDL